MGNGAVAEENTREEAGPAVILKNISILNYKNISEAKLDFSKKFNCFIGNNVEGKTNLLDAVYYLSFCHSMFSNVDSLLMKHDTEFFMIQGEYLHDDGETEEEIFASMKRGSKKQFKRQTLSFLVKDVLGFVIKVKI